MKRNGPIYPVTFCFIFSVSVEEPLGPMFTINLDKRHIMNMQIYDESFNISIGKYLPISYCHHFLKPLVTSSQALRGIRQICTQSPIVVFPLSFGVEPSGTNDQSKKSNNAHTTKL